VARKVNIRWSADVEMSAAHAAYVVARGLPCADLKTEQLLVGPVTEINSRLLSSSIDVAAFWQRFLSETLDESEISRACTIALLSAGCSEMQVEQTSKAVANRLSDARRAFLQRFPKLREQLDLRARPLRDRWDTCGPGLLREVERQIWESSPPDNWWASRLSVVMVQPIRGGDGGYDADSEKIWIEAMLTDVDPAVPEVLRIAWLITRMAIETHTRERSADQPLARPWALVSVPLVLTAAANLDLISRDRLPVQRAMELWQKADADVAETLSDWWSQWTDAPLPVALKELDQMLAAKTVSHDVSGDTGMIE
jgi:hypothetical protein